MWPSTDHCNISCCLPADRAQRHQHLLSISSRDKLNVTSCYHSVNLLLDTVQYAGCCPQRHMQVGSLLGVAAMSKLPTQDALQITLDVRKTTGRLRIPVRTTSPAAWAGGTRASALPIQSSCLRPVQKLVDYVMYPSLLLIRQVINHPSQHSCRISQRLTRRCSQVSSSQQSHGLTSNGMSAI